MIFSRSMLIEFAVVGLIAISLAGIEVHYAMTMVSQQVALAAASGGSLSPEVVHMIRTTAAPLAVVLNVALIHFHAFNYMTEIRKHSDDDTVLAQVRITVWVYECISCIAVLATVIMVLQATR